MYRPGREDAARAYVFSIVYGSLRTDVRVRLRVSNSQAKRGIPRVTSGCVKGERGVLWTPKVGTIERFSCALS